MSDFELTNSNIEDWETAEFWESDPMQNNQSLCRIILYVNWEKKEANVETQMHTNSTAGEVWYGLASEFKLPEDTDFTEFPKFFKEEIQPILKRIGEGFESFWNGSNWKGSFTKDAQEQMWNLQQLLEGANVPTHEMTYYFSLRDLYNIGGRDLIESDLKSEGIDLLTADLNNDGVMSLAVEIVTYGDGSDYKLIDVDVEEELKEIQKELIEEHDEREEEL
jgi:hypothetical protein